MLINAIIVYNYFVYFRNVPLENVKEVQPFHGLLKRKY